MQMIRDGIKEDAEKIAKIKIDNWRKTYSKIFPEDFLNNLDVTKEKEKYLKKALSANPTFSDAWIDMAGLALVECDLNLAKKYLFPVKTLDPKNYRYNYYSDLIKKKDISSGLQQAGEQENMNIKEVNDKI